MANCHYKKTVDISKVVSTSTTLETTLNDFIVWCYPELRGAKDTMKIYDKAILCALNDEVDTINKIAVQLLPGEGMQFFSADEIDPNSTDRPGDYDIEYLHSISLGGIPPHELILKIGTPVIQLRNLKPNLGLCNGTKLVAFQPIHCISKFYLLYIEI
jgi:hypothetical protein